MKKTIVAQKGVVILEVTDEDGNSLYWEVWKDGALIGTYDSKDEALVEYNDLIGEDDAEPAMPCETPEVTPNTPTHNDLEP